ncbi:MAG: hypothetical protein R3F53_12145 [Gammaproteobacteria bacterium]
MKLAQSTERLGEAVVNDRPSLAVSRARLPSETGYRTKFTARKDIEPIEAQLGEAKRAIDFDGRAALLEDGINDYLNAINELRPGVWRHDKVSINLSASGFTVRVGLSQVERCTWWNWIHSTLMAFHLLRTVKS